MFFCNLEHTAKKAIKTRSGKVKKAPTAKSRFHYITRTLHFKNIKKIHPKKLSLFGKYAEFCGRETGRVLESSRSL
jgi:hypothetical protein